MTIATQPIAPGALVDAIDAILPQTQCTRCGYPACRPYAEAIAEGRANVNRCPPGGKAGVEQLALLMGREALPLDPECGSEQTRRVAFIDEAHCIGCTLCIQACPVDAIVGAPRLMHTVVTNLCSGCDLCIAPCPVDCIDMVEASPDDLWDQPRMNAARARHLARTLRLAEERAAREARLARHAAALEGRAAAANESAAARQAVIEAARKRVRERRASRQSARHP